MSPGPGNASPVVVLFWYKLELNQVTASWSLLSDPSIYLCCAQSICWSHWRIHYVVGNFLKLKPEHCYFTWQRYHSPKYSELDTLKKKFLWLPWVTDPILVNVPRNCTSPNVPRLYRYSWLSISMNVELMGKGGWLCCTILCNGLEYPQIFVSVWQSGRWRGVPGTNTPWLPMDECIQKFLNHSYMFHVTLAQLVPVEVASFDFSS